MIFLQSPRVRSFLRRSGVTRIAYKLYFTVRKSSRYEAQFSDALLETILPGDCVWDVGANIGIYTQKFANRVGTAGKVIAFEPFAAAFGQLCSNVKEFPQVHCVRVALGWEDQNLKVESLGAANTANSLMHKSDSDQAELIHVKTGAKLIEEGLMSPTILKIDVEGFEEDVLWGFRENLRDSNCRAIFVEIHYTASSQRGFLRSPSRVVSMLQNLGFRTRWLDSSHLAALRSTGSF